MLNKNWFPTMGVVSMMVIYRPSAMGSGHIGPDPLCLSHLFLMGEGLKTTKTIKHGASISNRGHCPQTNWEKAL